VLDRSKRLRVTFALLSVTAALLVVSSCSLQQKPVPQERQAQVDHDLLLPLSAEPIDYDSRVKSLPIARLNNARSQIR